MVSGSDRVFTCMVHCTLGTQPPEAVLPLLRAQEGTGTAAERVIGAGLIALERQGDGAALKELFYIFAVTKEDFVHPLPVVELLWWSCSQMDEPTKETARLKDRAKDLALGSHCSHRSCIGFL